MSRLLVIANPYSGNARMRFDAAEAARLLRDMGFESLLTLTIDRQVKRHDHLEVWG